MKLILTFLLLAFLISEGVCRSEYRVSKAIKQFTSVVLQLTYFGKQEYYLKPTSPIIKKLKFTLQALGDRQLSIKITDIDSKRFQLPKGEPFPTDSFDNFTYPLLYVGATFKYTENPFDFELLEDKTQNILFSTYDGDFIFSDYYIEITTQLQNDLIYGLGERFSLNFRKTQGKWTVYNHAGDQQIDHGNGIETYGYYPFYLMVNQDRTAHINYLKSTHAMDVFKTESNGKHYLTYKIIGGVLNFRFMFGNNPISIVKGFHQNCIGTTAIPPFWSLGFHQSKWGYDSADALMNVIEGYKNEGLPLDTIWSDIDYMDDFKDFTVDVENFPLDVMKKITDEYRYVPIVDAGVSLDSQAYNIGKTKNLYLKDAEGKQYIGLVWPGKTTFVDYFHPNATNYWSQMLQSLNNKLNFSGIWLDMNQIQNFCDGPCSISNATSIFDFTNDLPYQPGNLSNIEFGTISLNCSHYNGMREFDGHPLFPLLQVYATNQYLKKSGRPFILSRSTTFGSGKYGFHWTGDNHASWQFLRSSVVDNLNMNLAGIQMVGPDICGFGGNTTEQLCARWFQLAAAYPFARDHSDYFSDPQEPYTLGGQVLKSAFTNLKLRYSLLKQYYTFLVDRRNYNLFWLSPMMRPQGISISNREDLDFVSSTQFLIGSRFLMAAPLLQEGETSRRVYFPNFQNAKWRNFYTGASYSSGFNIIDGVSMSDKLPLFIPEGKGFFIQNVTSITKTPQLLDDFIAVAALCYDDTRSNATVKYYQSQAQILSLSDYNNDALIDKCLRGACSYLVGFILTVGSNLSLKINYYATGPVTDAIYLERVRLYVEDRVIDFAPSSKAKLDVSGSIVFDIPNDTGYIDLWREIQIDSKKDKTNLKTQ